MIGIQIQIQSIKCHLFLTYLAVLSFNKSAKSLCNRPMTSNDFANDLPILDDLNNENYDSLTISNFARISKKRIFAISCSLVIVNVALGVEYSLATPLMAIFNMHSAMVAFVWFLCSAFTFFINPLSSSVSDSISNRFGRRRIFILIGSILILTSLTAFYFINSYADQFLTNVQAQPSLKHNLVFIGFFFSLLLLHSSITLIHSPSQSLLFELAPSHQHEQAKFISHIISSISFFLPFAVGGLHLAKYFSKTSEEEGLKNNQVLIIFSFFVILIALIICLLSTKEPSTNQSNQFQNPFKQMAQVFQYGPRPVFRMSIIYLFSWAAFTPVLTYLAHSFAFGSYQTIREFTVEGHCYGMIVLSLIQTTELMTFYFLPYVISKINMKWTYFLSMVLLSFLLIVSGVVHSLYVLVVIYAVIGFCSCTFKSIPFSLARIVVPAEQYSIHRNIFGAAASIGSGISMIILGGIVGYLAKSKTEIVIASGSVFSIIAAIGCKWMILPDQATNEHEYLYSNPIR